MTDTGGQASFDYDLLGRLTEWHNPFAETPIGGEPTHAYGLDDAGNITTEEITGGDEDVTITQSYDQGRLSERRADLDAGVATITIDQYSVMGEEKQRTTTLTPTGGPSSSETLNTTHDAQGHTASMTHTPTEGKPKVDFVYDGFDRLMSCTSDGRTKLFFYFGDTGRVAEETNASGATKSLYLSDSAGRPLAEVKEGNWSWLLRDAEGSVATRLSDSGNVKSHSAYDPYGATNDAGSGIAVGERDPETELGYQNESADAITGNILVGPRQYDPTTQRFTTADVFIDAGSNLSLATDPLTGNRYLFAAANPVALDDDGHEPCLSDCNRMYSGTQAQQRERDRNQTTVRSSQPVRPNGESVRAVDESSVLRAQHAQDLNRTWQQEMERLYSGDPYPWECQYPDYRRIDDHIDYCASLALPLDLPSDHFMEAFTGRDFGQWAREQTDESWHEIWDPTSQFVSDRVAGAYNTFANFGTTGGELIRQLVRPAVCYAAKLAC